LAYAPGFGGHAMDEKLIREKIQKKLDSRDLPYEASTAPIVGGNGGSGQVCAACDNAITASDKTPIGYEYRTGTSGSLSAIVEVAGGGGGS
jgi:hypothetical protein